MMFNIRDLSFNDLKLTESPLDDYQRVALLIFCYKEATQGNVGGFDVTNTLDIKQSNYKSNTAQNFKLNNLENCNSNVLNCFEYNLPDIKLCFSDEKNPLSKDNIDVKLLEFLNNNQELKCKLGISSDTLKNINYLQIFENIDPVNFESNGFLGMHHNHESINKHWDDDKPLIFLKNQQFKINKVNYDLIKESTLVNPNLSVMWTHDTGYVFITGIWRLYQDVMKGLTHLTRFNDDVTIKNGNAKNAILINNCFIDKVCFEEFDLIMNHIFYDDLEIDRDSIKIKRKRRNSSQLNKLKSPTVDNFDIGKKRSRTNSFGNAAKKEGTKIIKDECMKSTLQEKDDNPTLSTVVTNPNHIDLHWANVSNYLKEELLIVFKNYILNGENDGVNTDKMQNLSIYDLINRIRGGYIKIQGTWLPWIMAKEICKRFCFPIRYFLVPLFGSNFADECVKYHEEVIEKFKQNMPLEIFDNINNFFEKGKPTKSTKLNDDLMIDPLNKCVQQKNTYIGINEVPSCTLKQPVPKKLAKEIDMEKLLDFVYKNDISRGNFINNKDSAIKDTFLCDKSNGNNFKIERKGKQETNHNVIKSTMNDKNNGILKKKRKAYPRTKQMKKNLSKAFDILIQTARSTKPKTIPLTDLKNSRITSYYYGGSSRLLLLSIPTLRRKSDSNLTNDTSSLNYFDSDNYDRSRRNSDIVVSNYLQRFDGLQLLNHHQDQNSINKSQALSDNNVSMYRNKIPVNQFDETLTTTMSHIPVYVNTQNGKYQYNYVNASTQKTQVRSNFSNASMSQNKGLTSYYGKSRRISQTSVSKDLNNEASDLNVRKYTASHQNIDNGYQLVSNSKAILLRSDNTPRYVDKNHEYALTNKVVSLSNSKVKYNDENQIWNQNISLNK
ncbi:hypothetical protein TPHA_0C03310 [Tetrapisispora phaffii CBS 4417]|uniref:HTH APSES-type domain-containing protein n=1 Tax=Tetrapisispora phaffii (strain ATCC 24235 / CBS 4417 / NBRC 1672 / NRRL Y-8282 / UCD 70-5) TaxID=1071381 RepID=G8BRV7_TETPH|nr:hypothetical protein TPHA_0C03310 [Tetrapisispora phaffii CBS 4417]CCE62483.1 hypothetical protein TPHA_0C03310 [Tetrapisispora phaffii CBS 4417]